MSKLTMLRLRDFHLIHRHCVTYKLLGCLQRCPASIKGLSLCTTKHCHNEGARKDNGVESVRKGSNEGKDLQGEQRARGGIDVEDAVSDRTSFVLNTSNGQKDDMKTTNKDQKSTKAFSLSQDPSDSVKHNNSIQSACQDSATVMSARDDGKSRMREPPVPPDPETCCESGCVNCVWIKYAEEVKEHYPGPEHKEKLKEILGFIEDYNVKMFVKMELGIK